MALRFGLLVASPFLVWLAWDVSLFGLRGTWSDLTAASGWAYAHNGMLAAAALSIVILAVGLVFLVARVLCRKAR